MTTQTLRSEPPTYRELLDAALARQPRCCPACHDDSEIYPNFPDDTWACDRCGNVWEDAR